MRLILADSEGAIILGLYEVVSLARSLVVH